LSDKLEINEDINLLNSIVGLIDSARHKVATVVNQELTLLYWHIGKKINDDILSNERADYGKKILPELSFGLTNLYGKRFNKRNLQNFVKLNSVFQYLTILHTVCAKLSWSHIRNIIYKGQMELYLRWLEKNEQKEGENQPIGLILCSEKSPEQINYLMLDNDEHIKVAEYYTQLPDKKILLEKLEKAIQIAENNIKN